MSLLLDLGRPLDPNRGRGRGHSHMHSRGRGRGRGQDQDQGQDQPLTPSLRQGQDRKQLHKTDQIQCHVRLTTTPTRHEEPCPAISK